MNSSTTILVCASHSPLMYCYAQPPACRERSEQLFDAHADAIRAFDPELVVIFGPDHFNGFFLRLVPPFCVGTKCDAVADIGGFPGRLNVPSELALSLVEAVRARDVDVAVSYDMRIDHGFSQSLHRLLGGVDRYPTLPVYVNGIAPPFVPFRRSRMLGEAVGGFLSTLGKRILVLASGGMSHNPTRYYPALGNADPDVAGYQLHGGQAPSGKDMPGLTHAQWLQRLDEMHREGAHMLVDGRRTRADLKLNPDLDQQFLSILCGKQPQTADALDPKTMVAQGGIGFLELHTWVAACAAHRAVGGEAPSIDLYAEAQEYGIAFGMISSSAASAARS